MSFAVVRHPDIADPGIIPAAVLEAHRVHGWYRVSPWVDQPSDLHLPDYAESIVDLDAEPAKKSKSPAAPEKAKDES